MVDLVSEVVIGVFVKVFFPQKRGVEIIEREDPGWGKMLERGRSFDFEVAFPEVFLGALSFASLEAHHLMIILKN